MLLLIPLSRFLKPRKSSFLCFNKSFNSWALTLKNAASRNPHEAMNLYSQLHRQSVPLGTFFILFTLKSIASPFNLAIIRHLHAHVIIRGLSTHVYVATSILRAYVVASFGDACVLFDEMPVRNTVTWNTMIAGYSRSGDVNKAHAVFEAMPLRDVGSWSAMIAAYVNNRKWDCGLAVFREMMVSEVLKPDRVTVGSVLSGCAHMGSIGLIVGKSVHCFTVKNGWEMDVQMGTVLVDMYAKCGLLRYAHRVFELMQEKNVVTWTALIFGSAQHGPSKEAFSLFKMMQEMGVRPNEITFTGILKACAYAGLVEEGRKYFKMIEEYGLEPKIQHYGCMVDLFGKAGLVEEAYEMIRTMKFKPNVIIWGSFLSACKKHRKFEMAKRVIEQVLRVIRPENDEWVYTLISDLYVLNKNWDDAETVRKLMGDQHVRKARGSSFIRTGI